MATIYEVSKLAGVSLATVSRVMNNSARVSLKTREKVEAAMKELGYRPNSIAQSLASSRSNSVGILIPELHGPFFSTMLSSIEAELRAANKHVIITAGHSDEQKERESIEFLVSRQCDALIVHVYAVSNEYLLGLAAGSVPIVLIGRELPEIADRCFTIDNEYGGYLATRSLLEQGHRSLAYLAGPLWKSDGKARFAGHCRALAEFGLEPDDRLLAEGNYQEASGRLGMQRLLQAGRPFSGLACGNDEMAAGAIAVAREQGLTIPDDLSVIGFDNVFFTRYMHPQLSTINYPIDAMGQMAAQCILRGVYGRSEYEIQNRFEPSLVQRASTMGMPW
jgi:LacI family transcriptional regulator